MNPWVIPAGGNWFRPCSVCRLIQPVLCIDLMEQETIRIRVRPGSGSAPALTRSTRPPYSRLPPYTTCPKLMHPSPRGYSRFITTSSPAARTSPKTVSRIALLYATPPESATRGSPAPPLREPPSRRSPGRGYTGPTRRRRSPARRPATAGVPPQGAPASKRPRRRERVERGGRKRHDWYPLQLTFFLSLAVAGITSVSVSQ